MNRSLFKRVKKKFIIFKQQRKDRKQNRKMIKFYSFFINKDDLCFDIGANKGNRTEIFLKIGAKVVAVEPLQKCAEILKARFADNPNFNLIQKALDEKEGVNEILVCENASAISTMSEGWKSAVTESGRFTDFEWDNKEPVLTTTLDSLMEAYGVPSFCKIDVEGYEYQVLKGLSSPIKYVSFEFTPEYFDEAKHCIQHLQKIGDYLFNFSIGESMKLALKDWVDPKIIISELNKIHSKEIFGDVYASLQV